MNGENNPTSRTSAMDGIALPSQARKFTGALVAAELWLFAAFSALSLAAIGINTLISGEGPAAPYVVLVVGGFTLFPAMLYKVARALDRADPDHESVAPFASELHFALHR